jgi:hypothetical protein
MKTVAILVGSSDINLIADFKRMFIMYLLFTYKVVYWDKIAVLASRRS